MDSSAGVRMRFLRGARVLGILSLSLIGISCGDQYRPVAVPIVPPPPNPAAVHFVLVFSVNGSIDPGASSRLDVSGDTNIGVAQLGLGPAHATLTPTNTRVYAVNTLENTVSSYSPTPRDDRHSGNHNFSGGWFDARIRSHYGHANVYVADFGNNTVAAISTATNVVLNPLIAVGSQPVALVETPDQKKLYAVNQGSGNVTAISVVDRTVTQTIATGTAPVWALARSDSARVYVLNSGSGTVSAIDTTADALLSSVAVGAGANYMAYDGRLNRLYITNPTANTLTAVDVSSDPPAVLFATPVGTGPVGVAVLPDGSRAYAIGSTKLPPCTSDPADTQLCISSQVTVVNTSDGSVRKTIPLEPVVNITAASQTGSSTNYAYTLISGPALRPGMEIVIAGMADPGNNGTFSVASANAGTFTVVNGAGTTAASQSGTGAVVVEIPTTNPTGCDISGLGVPGGVAGGVRFRFSAAASADSTKIFAARCDAGSTTIISTSDDTPVVDMPAPLSAITPPNGGNALPQNPVFILAGP